ncbi:protein-tyrosine phosphatase [Microdochium nivale]|nr:protein-tyrosine phosphatase [Microdochium nivale]
MVDTAVWYSGTAGPATPHTCFYSLPTLHLERNPQAGFTMAPASAPDLPQPPFIHVDGLPNFRDAGGYPVASASASAPGQHEKQRMVRKGVIYRASEPSKLSPRGEARLRELGIREVYDLRSVVEIDRGIHEGASCTVREWQGARRNFVPVFLDQDYSPEAVALRVKNYADEAAVGFVAAYMNILHAGAAKDNQFSPFRTILTHLASVPPPPPSTSSSTTASEIKPSSPPPISNTETTTTTTTTATTSSISTSPPPPPSPSPPPAPAAVLIHCMAGKDRTGVICALALSLCGATDDVIAHEYGLTELGLRERHQELIRHLLNNPSMAGDEAGVRRMIGAQ